MFKILINKEMTGLFNDNGNKGIDNKEIVGFLINDKGIKELIKAIPVTEYYLSDPEKGRILITEEQALFIYDKLIDYHSSLDEKQKSGSVR